MNPEEFLAAILDFRNKVAEQSNILVGEDLTNLIQQYINDIDTALTQRDPEGYIFKITVLP